MAATERMVAFLTLVLALVITQTVAQSAAAESETLEGSETNVKDSIATYELSPAEELLEAASKAGYNLTLDVFDVAAAATDEEVEQMFPAPVAEAFIGHRRRDNFDLIREQMIGMIFTGTPQVLGSRPQRPLPPPPPRSRDSRPRPRPRPRPNNPTGRLNVQYNPQEVPAPENILKPLPFVPGPTMVKFPSHSKPAGIIPPRQSSGPRPRPRLPPPKENFHTVGENFGNAVGPDFGPVTFSDFNPSSANFGFNSNFANDFNHPNSPARPPPQSTPARPPTLNLRPSRPAPSRPAPSRPAPARPAATRPGPPRPIPVPGRPINTFGITVISDGGCVKYTDEICLDTLEYPHEAILSSLVRDPSRVDTMIAEVRSQSADDLVDGVSSKQESKYDYQHYFGNRRAGTENHAHRDFARDGGYLCPSEVKYARPKRARNSKGVWKYIVNMDKYSQTIRMEKCMKPGGACSYVSHHYRATCNQIYNYHRLLSWEDGRGLHMDIFKVPSCCSCHIQGYAYVFPPLNRRQHSSGSVQVSQTVRAPPSDINVLAPGSESPEQAYSPVNYPNVPTKPIRRRRPVNSSGVRRPGSGSNTVFRNGTLQTINRSEDVMEFESSGSRAHGGGGGAPIAPPKRNGFTPINNGSVNRRRRPSSNEESRVNYGYHPIIDFFSPYGSQRQR